MTDQLSLDFEPERWRRVVGFEGLYAVSNRGRVRSLGRWAKCRGGPDRDSHTRFVRGRVLRPGLARSGYLTVGLCRNGERLTEFVHRLTATAFHGPPPSPGHEVAHGDGDPSNNRAENLRWATRSENAADKIKHGTDNCGERHPCAKLTEADVIEIRRRCAAGEYQRTVARRFGVSQSTVSAAHNRRTWRHLGPSPGTRATRHESDPPPPPPASPDTTTATT